jgi:hypothetical protein
LLASADTFGLVVWIRPAALSVKSDALITRAQGVASTLPPVVFVQPRRQRQRVADPGAFGGGELRDLSEQSCA